MGSGAWKAPLQVKRSLSWRRSRSSAITRAKKWFCVVSEAPQQAGISKVGRLSSSMAESPFNTSKLNNKRIRAFAIEFASPPHSFCSNIQVCFDWSLITRHNNTDVMRRLRKCGFKSCRRRKCRTLRTDENMNASFRKAPDPCHWHHCGILNNVESMANIM